MKQQNFHIYVVANAQVGLYRSLLSLWKLDFQPNSVSIFYPPGKREIIEKSLFTVSEDTSDPGPTVRLIENKDGLRASILKDSSSLHFETTGFLVERDMLMPNYADIMSQNLDSYQKLGLAYYQRRKFGNSKLTFPVNGVKIPMSSLVIKSSQIINFINNTKFLQRNEFSYPYELDFLSINNVGRVIVQSNIPSPFDL
jgi:hypothetical protein